MGRVSLYYYTVKNMKPSQVTNRLRIKMGKECSLGVSPSDNYTVIQKVESPESLDFDPVFLARFPVEELMENRISILHSSKDMNWKATWEFEDKSALWNFNLHYFEYLFPLIKTWKDTGEKKYLDKTIEMIEGWIEANAARTSPAWSSYTIALRIVTWISYYGYVSDALTKEFQEEFLSSLHSQYVYLSGHLEKDILGNHYFEDLKSLVLAAIFFKDEAVLGKALKDFKAECKEEILPDGMHFELSPMYHKIIFEGMLRVSAALRGAGKKEAEIEAYLQPMLDVAYSFEDGLDRVPLFNDGGNNVAKSLDALLIVAKKMFGLKPRFKGKLESSGFYIFEKIINSRKWKLVVDAGQPGPKYIPGHAHCDAMSYELFRDEKPVVVNCGTYAYQCKERGFFRSTAAHNAVMVEGTEQSQCWGAFRLAKRSSTKVLNVTDDSITMEMTDQKGQKVKRTIKFSDYLTVRDEAKGKKLLSYVHLTEGFCIHSATGTSELYSDPYSEDYGKKDSITTTELQSNDRIEYMVSLGKQAIGETGKASAGQYKGYKPLAFLNKQIYFYKSGKLWTIRNTGMKIVADIVGGSWKDKSRTLIRLFRREPKFAVPIDDHRMIVAGFKKLLMVDVNNKDVQMICESRAGFSDPLNICKTDNNWLMVWGDYGSNPNHEAINIYGLRADLTVETVYSFQPGQIRHIHNIIPRLKGGYYIFTGDQEAGAGIYIADYDFKSVVPAFTGKQQYRAVVGFDTPNGLLYATDAVNEQNYVYHIKGDEPEQIYELNGSCIYGTKYNGSYYFATTVEPDENNRGLTSWVSRKRGAGILSDEVKLVEIDNGMTGRVIASYKKDMWPMKLMQYGSIQFPHGESDEMWLYPVAVKKFDGKAVRYDR